MHNAIMEILSKIPAGCVFDSHYVISQLIKNYSDVYLEYSCSISGPNKTSTVHGHIGQEIAKFESDSELQIRRLDYISWSENIHGKPSKCAAWIKL